MRHILVLGLATLALAARPSLANVRAPTDPPQPVVRPQNPRLVIEVDEKATVNRLIVPRQFLTVQPAPGQPPRRGFGSISTIMVGTALAMSLAFGGLWLVRRRAGAPGGGITAMLLAIAIIGIGATAAFADVRPPLDASGDGSEPGGSDDGRVAIIVAGLALTLAMVAAGAWYLRRRLRPAGLTLPVVLALCVVALGGTALWADIAPPFGRRPTPPPVRPVPPPLPVLATLDNVRTEMVPQGVAIRLVLTPATKAKLVEALKSEEKKAD